MKKLIATMCLTALATAAFAQGTVRFANSAQTLVMNGLTGQAVASTGTFYFGLFTGADGETDATKIATLGLYATNSATADGRFVLLPLTGVAVPGWTTGDTKTFVVRGWSADLGHDWNPLWLEGTFPGATPNSVFGTSMIGVGAAGGTDSLGNPVPALSIFGAAPALTEGFTLEVVPEPTTMALAGLGVAALLIFRRRK